MADETPVTPTATPAAPAPQPDEGLLHELATSAGLDPEAIVATAKAIRQHPWQVAKEVGSAQAGEFVDAGHHLRDTALSALNGVASAITNPEAKATAIARLKSPGLINKIQGAEEYATAAVPLVGGNYVKAEEQAGRGNIAGSIGTTLGTTLPLVTDTEGAEGIKAHLAETGKTFVESAKEGMQRAAVATAPEGSAEAGFAKIPGSKKVRGATPKPTVTSGEDVVTHIQNTTLDKISREEAHQRAGLDSGGDYRLTDIPTANLEAGDDYDPKLAQKYADKKGPLPAIVLDGDGRIRDGNHRVAAAQLRGEPTVKAYVPIDATETAPDKLAAVPGAKFVGKTPAPPLYSKEGAQPLADHIGAQVVGSVATKGASTHDLDLKVDNYDQAAVEAAMKEKGFEPVGSSILSPKEIKASGKDFGTAADEWARAHHFESTAEPHQKVDVWHKEPAEPVSAPAETAPAAEYHPDLQKIVDAPGVTVHQDPTQLTNPHRGSFIAPDGKYITMPAGAEHDKMIDKIRPNALQEEDSRINFLNDTGAMRVRPAVDRAGQTLHITVPKDGVTPEQVDALKQAVGGGMKSRGNLLMDTADAPLKSRDSYKEVVSPADIDEELHKVGAHPDQAKAAEAPTDEHTFSHKTFGVDDSVGRIDAHNATGEAVGHVTYNLPAPNKRIGDFNATVAMAAVDEPGKGLGQKLYLETAAQAKAKGARYLVSDTTHGVDPSAVRVWDKLIEKGYPVEKLGKTKYRMDLSKLSEAAAETPKEVAPNSDVQASAQKYAKAQGMPEINHAPVQADAAHATEIAKLYDEAQHTPNDPKVKAAYDALKSETLQQFHHLQDDLGLKFEPQTEDPYKSAGEMMADVKNNKRLKVYSTADELPKDHPLSEIAPGTGGQTYNTVFRWVHDAMGHAAGGNDFSENGEKSATEAHAQMYSDAARPAMRAETEGQTSWFFHNPKIEAGEAQPGTFAPQKATILPDESLEDKLKKGVSRDNSITTNIPLSKISVSENAYTGASRNLSKGAGSKTTGPVQLAYNPANGQFLVEDGMHRIVQANRNNDATIRATIHSAPTDAANVAKGTKMNLEPTPWHEVAGDAAETDEAGGIDPHTGKSDTTGLGTEILPEARQPLDHAPTAKDFAKFYDQHKDLFDKHPELRIGWDNKSAVDGGHEINIGAVGPGAEAVARKLDQKSAFNIEKGEVIPTGGTGLKTNFPKSYSIEKRLADLKNPSPFAPSTGGTPEAPAAGAAMQKGLGKGLKKK